MKSPLKVLFFSFLVSIFCGSAFASSPFDIILGKTPDIAVTDIHQEASYVYLRVCNFGGSITDSDTSIALAMKKTGGGVVSMVEPVILQTNDCHEFRMATLDELGIGSSGTYEISGGALLKNGKTEKLTGNNKITKSIAIAYPSTYSSNYYSNNNYYNNNYCNSYNGYCSNNSYNYSDTSFNFCTASNNYCNNNTYYCDSSNRYCYRDPNSNNNTYYCTQNYCSSNGTYNGTVTYYRSNICSAWDSTCNYDYYKSTNTSYQYNNQYCTYSNNYCNNNYSNNYYNNGYYNNSQYDKPDLVIRSVSQDSSDKHIIAQICNNGGDMISSASIRTNFSSNGSTTAYNTVRLSHEQCINSVVYATPESIGINYSGNYSITATVAFENNVYEQNSSNNSMTQYLYVEMNRNQKSDLTVNYITANDSNKTVTARVCNVGDDMLDSNNWILEVANTTTNSSMKNMGSRLSKGQCVDVTNSYSSLGVYQNGGYNFRATVDTEGNISEQSEWNNTLNQYLQLWANYNYR